MKTRVIFFLMVLFVGFSSMAQTWHTYMNYHVGVFGPWEAFKLDPYRNDLWYLKKEHAQCWHLTTGEVDTATFATCPDQCDKDVAFTPDYVYLLASNSGLYRVNIDYSITNVYFNNDVGVNIFDNGDTIYMTFPSSNYLAYTANGSILSSPGFDRVVARGEVKYPSFSINSGLQKFTGMSGNGYEHYYTIDEEYICGQFHDIKFSPFSDTIYVSCTAGISVGYNYDFMDSITPDNTTNMPSANVLEFEFDRENRIWACFGDANDVPFAFARLEGDTWTNRYDNTNCPVDFTKYRGMEIDTLGNVWIAGNTHTSVLAFDDAPQWLSVKEQAQLAFSVVPNPAEEMLTIELQEAEKAELEIVTISGQVLETIAINEVQTTVNVAALPAGMYWIRVQTATGTGVQKWMKR